MALSCLRMLRDAATDFRDDHALRLAAALAYYSAFSLAPLLLIAISIAGAVFGEEAARGAVQGQIAGAMGERAAAGIEAMIASARDSGRSGIMAGVGVLLLLLAASGVFGQLQDALDTIWEVEPRASGGLRAFLLKRFLSLTMVLGTGFLLLVSLVLSAVVSAFTGAFERWLAVPGFVWQTLSFLLSFGVVTSLFAMIFKFLPDARVRWRDVWAGAAMTAALFTVGKFLLALYLGRSEAASAFGAAGALVLVLTWVYYSSLILLFGAELTQVYARARGREIGARP
ncbi:MAG TPA: YihY/virulence factor BrkB family protein [Myxococcota bacterium]|nr:YihY/virulence factor BrkB family protein [Myxococcota bacterium]